MINLKIVNIDKIEITDLETEMVDIEVEDNHNFILANGIITHNCGKSTTCFSNAESVSSLLKKPIYAVGMDSAVLPNFIIPVDMIENVPNDSLLVVSEGSIESNARDSMSQKNKNIAKLIPIISHRNIWAWWASQSGFKLDKNLIFEADTLILHKPSLMQLGGERKIIKELYNQYLPELNFWIMKLRTEKGITAVHSEQFKGIVRWILPKWWNNSISKSYKSADIYG